MPEILYPELSYAVIGAAMAVHTALGPGYLERVYHNALAHELRLRDVLFQEFVKLPVVYRAVVVGDYEVDFVVANQIALELKAVVAFHPRHVAQTMNYLAATGLRLGILINFGADSLQHKRIVR